MDNFNHTESQPFYNTLEFSEEQWQDENKKALFLQKIIERLYLANPTAFLSPWQVRDFLSSKMGKELNINSVRRSITNLKNELKLIKTRKMRMGNAGQTEHHYILYSEEMLMHSIQDVYKKGKKTAAQIAGEIINSKPVIIFE